MTWLDSTRWASRIYLGRWVAGTAGDRGVVEPATGDQLGRIGLASPADVVTAAEQSVVAQREWAARPYTERAAVFRRAGDLLTEHATEIQDWIVRESGSVPGKAELEVHLTAQECYEAASLPGRAYGQLLPSELPRRSWAQRVPAGVVGVIAPFNFPLILAMRSVAPALALGNAVVLKPDLRTAVCGGVVIARVLADAGLPDGLFHMLPGRADIGEAVVTDPRIRIISFTGSTNSGRRVGQLAAEHFKRVHLELGGNSALVVLDDVDLPAAVSAGAWGSFLHQGQICMTTGRHLVHESIYDAYVAALAEKADHLPVGNPATEQVALGPLIDGGQLARVHNLVKDTVDAGARLAAGGTFTGLCYRPTVLADVARDMPAYAQEVFGPVAPVVRFGSLDEAAKLASDTEYGLSLGILTGDVMKGLELAERIPTGIVHINDQTVNDEAIVPFGGLGASGTGSRFGGPEANVDAFTESRWITIRDSIAPYPF